MKKKFFILAFLACMVLMLSACGPKKCTSQVCIEGECTEIEIPCENEVQDVPDTPDEPTEPVSSDDSVNTDNSEPGTEPATPTITPTPSKPSMLNVPTLVEDPGLNYDTLNPNEQAATNAFQAIVDGDYQGLLNMFYLEDDRFTDIDDMKTYFQISNYVSIKGKDVTIIDAEANGTGMDISVTIKYFIGPPTDPTLGEQEYETWNISLIYKDDSWKYVDDNFIGKNFSIKANKGAIVKLDGIELVGQESYNSMTYIIPTISKVEHTVEITYKGETKSHLIVPGRDSADFVIEEKS